MKAYSFFLVTCLFSLAACAPYQLEPVNDAPVIAHHEIDVVFDEAPAPVAPAVVAPTFKDLSPSAWTVQIAALKDLEKMDTVESQNRLDDVIRVPTRDAQLGELHTVLVGVYDSLEDAKQVARELPKKVAGDDPWIRSVASVQAVMR